MLTAALVKHDVEARTWETEGLESTMDLFATIQAVAPSFAKSLSAIQFSQPPLVKMHGLVDSREASEDPTGEPARHDPRAVGIDRKDVVRVGGAPDRGRCRVDSSRSRPPARRR